MIQKLLKKITISSNPLLRFITCYFRFIGRFPLVQLLKLRKNKKFVKHILDVQRDRGFNMWTDEMAFLYYAAVAASKLEGDFAEFGVFNAGSSKIIAEAKGNRPFHLFDTFEGLPKPELIDGNFSEKQFTASLESVQEYLKDFNNISFYKGIFPLSAKSLEPNTMFSLVHLDVDLYKSTLVGLQFFYSKMTKGGIIVSHDYSILEGVKKAFDEFFGDKPEPIIELPTSQCLIIKL